MADLTKESKFLSLVLRHKPEVIGLILDANGWANIDILVEQARKCGRTWTRELVLEIVKTCPKQRYAISEDGKNIRANQGHSIEVDLELKREYPPQFLYHGTGSQYIASILSNGIEKRSRNHVHLSSDMETAVKVGKRHGKPTVIVIDTDKMKKDNIEFFRSENGVWLTEYVDPKYFFNIVYNPAIGD